MPTVVDPHNPLGLDLSPAGIAATAAASRTTPRDPDLGWSDGMVPNYVGPANLTPEETNRDQAAADAFDNASETYAKTQEQPIGPLLALVAAGLSLPFALSALGIGAAGAGAAGAGAAGADAAATAGALGGAAGAAGAGAAGAAGAGAAGAGAAGAGALGALGGTTLDGLVVTAAASGLSVPAIAAAVGIPTLAVSSILANSGDSSVLTGNPGSDTVSSPTATDPAATPSVDQLTVTAPAASGGINPALLAAGGAGALGALGAGGGGGGTPALGDYTGAGVPESVPGPTAGTNGDLGDLPLGNTSTSIPDQILNWVKANPLQAAGLGLTLGGALGGSGAGTGSYGVPSGSGTPGTLSSLNPIFSASLPAPTQAARGAARQMPTDFNWNRYAIDNPAQSFFANIPQAQPATFTAPTPDQLRAEGAARLGLPNIDAVKAAFRGPGYATGGRIDFAVHGAGDGRSDSIPARLSDGEYVVDAETLSLLGNGSNEAGAKKMDQFRVNLRKQKGRDLAQGRFTVSANAPETYMSGGRV